MINKALLMVPGPTPMAPSVAQALTRPMINHRGESFKALFQEVIPGLQALFRTQQAVFVVPSAGSGGWEFGLVNFLSPGDRVLSLSTGDFGDRFARAAAALGLEVEKPETAWGQHFDPARLEERLQADKEYAIKAVLITHNETSTGVTNPLQELTASVRRLNHPALVLVDSVSGLGALPLEFDAWDLDFVMTGTQKALGLPPGLMLCAVSERAMAAHKVARLPRFYFDLAAYKKGWPEASPPYTPALSLWYGLQESLRLLQQETLEGSWARHRLLGAMTRAGVKATGLQLLAEDEQYASNSVTALIPPEGLTAGALRKTARETYHVQLAGGQAHMQNTLVRIGHLGFIDPLDVIQALTALELALVHHGRLTAPGAAVAAAQRVWLEHAMGEGK